MSVSGWTLILSHQSPASCPRLGVLRLDKESWMDEDDVTGSTTLPPTAGDVSLPQAHVSN